MNKQLFLGLDQGSSGTKASLVNVEGKEVFSTSRSVLLKKISDKEIEQDLIEVLQSVKEVIKDCQRFARENSLNIEAIALACQRSGVGAWDKITGKIRHNLIHWSDTRTQGIIDALASHSQDIFSKTGMPLTPHYSASKFCYLQKQFPNQDVMIGTLDSYIMHQLVSEKPFVTDDTMAARSMIFDLSTSEWNEDLAKIFSVDIKRLPVVKKVVEHRGHIEGIPLVASIGDQQAALYGKFLSGEKLLLNLGTIASLVFVLGNKIVQEKGFITSILYSKVNSDTEYLLEAVSNNCGAIFSYILQEEKLADSLAEIDSICLSDNSLGVLFWDKQGTATPYWKSGIGKHLRNLDSKDKKSLVRTLIENIANFIIYNLDIIKNNHPTLLIDKVLPVSGGGSVSKYLCQYIADVTGLELWNTGLQATSYGAALIAMKESFNIHYLSNEVAKYKPQTNDLFVSRYNKWRVLYEELIK
jgi:glycerol kinase